MAKRTAAETRFWSKVALTESCWLWTGATTPFGHGTIWLGSSGEGRGYAHRVSWELAHGPIPVDVCVLHHCDTPACVRPEHLFLGTQADNMRDMASKGRSQRWCADLTHCKRGHPFDAANTFVKTSGSRECRTCSNEAQRKRRAARR